MDYYRDAIADGDWELEDETTLEQAGGGGVISAWKGNRQLIILTGSNGVETVIGVKIMEPRKRTAERRPRLVLDFGVHFPAQLLSPGGMPLRSEGSFLRCS